MAKSHLNKTYSCAVLDGYWQSYRALYGRKHQPLQVFMSPCTTPVNFCRFHEAFVPYEGTCVTFEVDHETHNSRRKHA